MTDIDKKNIYTALVDLLTIHCNTCLDKHQMEKILLCTFKLQLIEYEEQNNEDAWELWESLARTLGIKISAPLMPHSLRASGQSTCNCSNGVCTLC